jgi:ABC-type antimicrobial peptide transport system permease subunit
MDHALFSLALQGTLRKKKSSGLIFLVLLVSFSFVIVSLSLTGSITKTNEELGKNTYGEWYYAIPSGLEEDAAWLAEEKAAGMLESFGTMRNYGTVAGSTVTENNATLVGFGTVDDAMIEVGRLRLDSGHWPSAENEIAMEANTLTLLGYDTTLGQEIEISIAFNYSSERSYAITHTFVLCGVIHEFSNLWMLNQNQENRLLASAIVTQETAEALQATAKSAVSAQDAEGIAATPQYFISVGSKTLGKLGSELNGYLRSTRTGSSGDTTACTNTAISESGTGAGYNKVYLAMIAAVTILAILSVYIIHLPEELHRFATLRSIGITRRQLALLVGFETLLLVLPAILFGTVCGALCTKLALRLLLYSGSAAVQVAIPFGSLFGVTLLWVAAILAARFVLFAVVVRVPLVGRFALQRKTAQWLKRLRGGMIALLLALFGFILIFTKMEVLTPELYVESYQSAVHYSITAVTYADDGSVTPGLISEQDVDYFRQIPGASLVFETSNLTVGLSFPGMSERTARFIAVDDDLWDSIFDFGEDAEAFRNGELVLVCVPGEDVPDQNLSDALADAQSRVFVLPDEDISNRDYLLPDGEVTLHIYNNSGGLIEEVSSAASVRTISMETIWDGYALLSTSYWDPYSIVCSHTFLEKLLSEMQPGEAWGAFVTGGAFGYGELSVHLSPYANATAADVAAGYYCLKYGLVLSNRRQMLSSYELDNSQQVILLYASGCCIALMCLLILISLLSLESEQEKHSFGILRALGMSGRQMRAKVCGKAALRCLLATAGGWVVYLCYATIGKMKYEATDLPEIAHTARLVSPAEAMRANIEYWASMGCTMRLVWMLTGICLVVSLVVLLIAKWGLIRNALNGNSGNKGEWNV